MEGNESKPEETSGADGEGEIVNAFFAGDTGQHLFDAQAVDVSRMLPGTIIGAVDGWPELTWFAARMRSRLIEKDRERGGKTWKGVPPEQILLKLNDHVFHLEEAIYNCDGPRTIKKAVDVANLAMMIHDVATAAARASAVPAPDAAKARS